MGAFSRRTVLLLLGGVLAELAFLGVAAGISIPRLLLDPGVEAMTLGQAQTATFDAHRAIANVLRENPNLTLEETAAVVNNLSASGHALDVFVLPLYLHAAAAVFCYLRVKTTERRVRPSRLSPSARRLRAKTEERHARRWLFCGLFFGLAAVVKLLWGSPADLVDVEQGTFSNENASSAADDLRDDTWRDGKR